MKKRRLGMEAPMRIATNAMKTKSEIAIKSTRARQSPTRLGVPIN